MWKPEHKVSHTFADFLLHVKPDVIVNGVFSMCRLAQDNCLCFSAVQLGCGKLPFDGTKQRVEVARCVCNNSASTIVHGKQDAPAQKLALVQCHGLRWKQQNGRPPAAQGSANPAPPHTLPSWWLQLHYWGPQVRSEGSNSCSLCPCPLHAASHCPSLWSPEGTGCCPLCPALLHAAGCCCHLDCW